MQKLGIGLLALVASIIVFLISATFFVDSPGLIAEDGDAPSGEVANGEDISGEVASGEHTSGEVASGGESPAWLAELEQSTGSPVTNDSTTSSTSDQRESYDAEVNPGDSIQDVVDRLQPGSVVLIKSGIHQGQMVKPKSGMTFIGEEGAVLDGGNETPYAFVTWRSEAAHDVTIRGLEIRNYMPELAHAAITSQGGTGWVIEGCEVHHALHGGIRVDSNSTVRNCHLHHNGKIGLKASGKNIIIENNEIAYNNPDDIHDPTFEAGGIKFGQSDMVVVRGNHVHHNHGHGVWADIDAIHTLYESNVIENNHLGGINHEISYDAVIRNNTIRNNGHNDSREWLWGAGIEIRGPNVTVHGNLVENNRQGIIVIQTGRGEGEHGSYDPINILVRANTIANTGLNGAGVGNGSTRIYETVTFDSNQYRYDDVSSEWWTWEGQTLTWEQWLATGHDGSGELRASG